MPSPLVVAVGLATVDLVQRVPELPGPGDKLESGGLELSAGGPAANAAVTVAALGGRARLVTITPAGQELVELSLPVVRAVEAAWTEHLGPTRTRQLREALTELRTITDPFANVTEVS